MTSIDKMQQKYLLIDCDPGLDDCFAIMMALSLSRELDVKVVGITTVNGNVCAKQVTLNAVRTVKLYNMIDQVPIYRGSERAIIDMPDKVNSSFYHGKDGFGDAPNAEPRADESLLDFVQKEHAVNAIIRLSKEYEGKLQILALGPLTNIALAARIDPDLPKRVKSLHVLGGTIRGFGNITPGAEYNFFTDPEAAHITLSSFSSKCLVQLVTYEVTIDHAVPIDWFDDLLKGDDIRRRFFGQIYQTASQRERKEASRGMSKGYVICDAYIMGIVLDPSSIIKSRKVQMSVELAGNISRGNLVIDHNRKGSPHLHQGEIELIEEIDVEKFKQLMAKTFPR